MDDCSFPELMEWADYYAEEPFGEWRDDARAAMIASVIANCNRDPKQRSEPYLLSDFMLFDKTKRVDDSPVDGVEDDGAHIDPGLIGWLFAEAKPSVH